MGIFLFLSVLARDLRFSSGFLRFLTVSPLKTDLGHVLLPDTHTVILTLGLEKVLQSLGLSITKKVRHLVLWGELVNTTK